MAKSKMVILKPIHKFGTDGRVYVVGEEYKMARKDVPAVRKGSYKLESVKSDEEVKKETEAKAKAEAEKAEAEELAKMEAEEKAEADKLAKEEEAKAKADAEAKK